MNTNTEFSVISNRAIYRPLYNHCSSFVHLLMLVVCPCTDIRGLYGGCVLTWGPHMAGIHRKDKTSRESSMLSVMCHLCGEVNTQSADTSAFKTKPCYVCPCGSACFPIISDVSQVCVCCSSDIREECSTECIAGTFVCQHIAPTPPPQGNQVIKNKPVLKQETRNEDEDKRGSLFSNEGLKGV